MLDACSALGDYAPQMRALMTFAAYTGMRPGELFALGVVATSTSRPTASTYSGASTRVGLTFRSRIRPGRSLCRRRHGTRCCASPPVAGRLVFLSKRGDRLSQPTLSGYWWQVRARAGLEHDFYLATKHLGVHLLYKLGLSTRAIGAQMGWSPSAVEALLRVYGHIDLVALEEVDALYAGNVVPLRSADAQTDAQAADSAS